MTNTVCKAIPDPGPTPDPQPIKDLVPGDFCPDQTENPCFAGSTCESGVCTVSEDTLGKSCKSGTDPENRMCDVGQYCATDATSGDMTCTAVVAPGSKCDTDVECGFQAFCDTFTDAANPVCAMDGSLKDGVQYTAVTEMSAMCASGNTHNAAAAGNDPEYWCMKATTSVTSNTEPVALGTKCKANTYTTTTDPTAVTEGEFDALCGFNQNDQAYCPMHKGDSMYADMWSAWTKALADTSNGDKKGASQACNPSSAGLPGSISSNSGCKALWTTLGSDNWQKTYNQAMWVSVLQGWPNVANNADCVMTLLTSGYHNSNAVSLALTSMLAVVAMLFF